MIILPTRNRPEGLKRFAEHYRKTCSTETVVVVYELEFWDNYASVLENLPTNWWCIISDGGSIGAALNTAFEQFPNESVYGVVCDDTIPRTEHWDKELTAAALEHGFAWPNDLHQRSNFACHFFINGDTVRNVGFIAHPKLKHYGIDNFWFHLHHNHRKYLDHVILEHTNLVTGKAQMDDTYQHSIQFKQDDWNEWQSILKTGMDKYRKLIAPLPY